MPQVPQYGDQVQPEELPGARQRAPAALGMADALPQEQAQVGRQIQGVGAEIGDLYQQHERSIVNQQDAQFVEGATKILNDPQNGYLNQRGQNAVQGRDGTLKSLRDLGQNLADKLPDDSSREAFKDILAKRINAYTVQVDHHASRETTNWSINSSKARQVASGQAAIVSYNPVAGSDNTAYRQNMATAHVELEHQADLAGMDADTKALYVKEGMSKVHGGVIEHLLDNNQTAAARDYFNNVRDQMDVQTADKVSKLLKVSADKSDALGLALDIRSKYATIGEQEKALDQMFTDGKITPDAHDMALQRLRADNKQLHEEQSEQDRSLLGSVWDLRRTNPNATVSDLSASQISYIKQRGLGPQVDAIFSHGPATDNPRLFLDLMDDAAKHPVEFQNMDITPYKAQLSDAHYATLERAHIAIVSQDAKGMEANKLVQQAMSVFRNDLKAAGLNLSPKAGSTDAENLAQFEGSVHDRIVQELANDPKITPERLRQITLGMARDQALTGTGTFWDTKKPPYQMTPKEMAQAWTVPDDSRKRIIAYLKSKHRPVTEEAIQYWYKVGQGVNVNALLGEQQEPGTKK